MTVTSTPLAPFGPEIWVKRVPLRFLSFEMGTRMTVIRLSDGGLFVHSPVKMTGETKAAVEALGPIRYLIAPNRLHHLFVADWTDAFPKAELWGVPELMKKRADLPWTGVLGETAEPGWAAEVDQAMVTSSFQHEAEFFHRRSKTLIVVDLLESVWPGDDPWTYRLFSKLFGTWKRPTTTYDQRLTFVHRAGPRAAVRRMLEWDFERIIMAPVRVIETDAQAVFRKGIAWLTP